MFYANNLPVDTTVTGNHYICAPDISLSSDYTQSFFQDLKCGVIMDNSPDSISYWLPDKAIYPNSSLVFSVSNNVIRLFWQSSK